MYAYGTPEGEPRNALFARGRVFASERIETVRTGGMQIDFVDGTVLRLGSSSDIILDAFVYDPDSGTGQLVANIGKGAFRFVTGKLGGPNFKVVTPTAVIGVRGTDFVVRVGEDGATQVAVLDGEVEMAALEGAADAVVVTTAPFPRIDDRALGLGGTGPDPDSDAADFETEGVDTGSY